MCDNNAAIDALATAFNEGEAELLAGGAPDPANVQEKAQNRIELNGMSLDILDDSFYVWPKRIREDISHIRESYLSELSTLNQMATSDFETAYYSTFAETEGGATAGQNIRYELGLDANTSTSCDDFYGKLPEIHAETASRS
ncbi:hypothetical protein D9V30_05160 [Mycetocola reblochoni]|uniref:Uncharacterized protein n=1 Tax=Mycetocola reblochoni TaxID=331618 RepID=A0A3L6ZQ68_9MICO|nr:hypothetical protein D9V30_05160 [Mycetocola reblochoni]